MVSNYHPSEKNIRRRYGLEAVGDRKKTTADPNPKSTMLLGFSFA